MNPTLGTYKRKFLFSCVGKLPATMVEAFAKEFIKKAGMTPARQGRIDHYPYNGGGGQGYTGFFPLMESYLLVDYYDDLREVEILLSTCKPDRINLDDLTGLIRARIGMVKEVGTL